MPVPGSTQQPTAPAEQWDILQALVPERDRGHDRMLTPPGHPWLYGFHPDAWEVAAIKDGKGRVRHVAVPALIHLSLAPGVNQTHTLRRGQQPADAYRDALRGFGERDITPLNPTTPIPADCLPADVPSGGYRREVAARNPITGIEGVAFLEAWSVPISTPGNAPQRFRFDRASYNRWRVWLVEKGIVPQPTESALRNLERDARRTLHRREAQAYTPEVRERMLGEAREALTATQQVAEAK